MFQFAEPAHQETRSKKKIENPTYSDGSAIEQNNSKNAQEVQRERR